MSNLPKNHQQLYFDALVRTQKMETVFSLIQASYHARKTKDKDVIKDEIKERLKYAYGLFRDNVNGYDNGVGSYNGDGFESQYTIGHEMCIWKNSSLELTNKAMDVAMHKITIRDYFDIFFLNYFQPINNIGVHPLYCILNYMIKNNVDSIEKDKLSDALGVEVSNGAGNALCNFLSGTNYIEFDDNKLIRYVGKCSIDNLISMCNTTYIGEEGYKKALVELSEEEKYVNYIMSSNETSFYSDNGNKSSSLSKRKHNVIVFGAPGTGKSFKLNIEKDQLVQSEEQYERVTFHPDYTYANFVGTYKPVMTNSNEIINQNDKEIIEVLNDKRLNAQEKFDHLKDKFESNKSLSTLPILISMYSDGDFETNEKSNSDVQKIHGKKLRQYVKLLKNNNADCNISYEYVPGPFMRLFVKAKKNPNTTYLLLIEEINRANVAAVFGDLFQLLDRDDNEESTYPVEASEDIKNFLLNSGIELENNKIKIPNNLFIWATMNSADQGVFPMDTAFKRRWDFDYIGINNNEKGIDDIKFEIKTINKNNYEDTSFLYWNKLRKSINKYLSDNKINEDKQLGPYFISKKVLLSNDKKEFMDTFKNKVIMYLFEDAAKQKRIDLFSGVMNRANEGYDVNSYSSICECFDKYGIEIFNNLIQNDYGKRIATKEKGIDQ